MSRYGPPPRPFVDATTKRRSRTMLERIDAMAERVDDLLRQLDEHDAYMHEWRATGVEPIQDSFGRMFDFSGAVAEIYTAWERAHNES